MTHFLHLSPEFGGLKRDIFKKILKLKTILARNTLREKYFNSLEMFAIEKKSDK